MTPDISDIRKMPYEAKDRLINQVKEAKRVLKITEKPDTEEFKMSAKVTGAGMILIGAIGFLFYMASTLL